MTARTQISEWFRTNDRAVRLRDALFPFFVLGILLVILLKSYPALQHDHQWFDFTTILLALMALFFGFVQYKDARRHTRKMEDIANSMSTRYIGTFPRDLEDIAEIVSRADHDFVALVSFVSYGQYAKPEGFDRLLQEVKAAKRRKVNVVFYVYDDDPALKTLQSRFPESNWATEIQSECYRAFFAFNPGMTRPSSHEEFLNMYRRLEGEARSQLADKGVSIQLLNNQERLYFWLGDDKDAVFSFVSASGGDPLCFRTRDARMIETFQRVLKPYRSLPSYLEVKKGLREKRSKPRIGPEVAELRVHSVQPNFLAETSEPSESRQRTG
jgi:hypothetical protein